MALQLAGFDGTMWTPTISGQLVIVFRRQSSHAAGAREERPV
jgi:hypothetical protein